MDNPAQRERVSTLLFYAAIVALAYLVYRVFEPFLVPLAWAVILVVLFYPLQERYERKWGKSRAAALNTFAVTCVLILPALALGTMFVHQMIQAASGIATAYQAGKMDWLNDAWQWLAQHAGESGVDLPSLLQKAGGWLGSNAAEVLGNVLSHTAGFLFDLFVTVFAMFFFFRDADMFMTEIRGLMPFDRAQSDRMLARAQELIIATMLTSLIIAAVQGAIGGVGFAIAGIGTAVFWGVMMAFCSLIPVVGSTLIWGAAAIWLVASGHWGKAIVLVAICGGLMGSVDQFLRPILLSGRTQLNTLFIFISVLGGIAVFGVLGIVLGPVVVATFAGLLEAYSETSKAS
ncbi:MAG TPA: AI-2E family transporter [Candidatus Acidoferrales bacterium]|nr:AI-2E family transporter [Candidatus Acidoferrales bacterium]